MDEMKYYELLGRYSEREIAFMKATKSNWNRETEKMPKYIDADALISELKDYLDNCVMYNSQIEKEIYDDKVLFAIDCLKNSPDADVEQARKWIMVEERLPEKRQEVLLLFEENMAVGFWTGDREYQFWFANSDDGYDSECDGVPIYWMSLPEPPKMDGGSE